MKKNLSKSQKNYPSCPMSPISKIKSIHHKSKNSPDSNKVMKSQETSSTSATNLKKLPTRASLLKNKALLNKMGFRTELDFKPINLFESPKETSQLYSIQMFDFWGDKEKIRFLKKQGFWEAYKDMISQSNKSKLYYSKTFKQPVAPQVLDITSRCKAKNALEGSFSNSFHHRGEVINAVSDISIRTAGGSERLEKLEAIQNKCVKLESDTKLLKKNAFEFRSEISSRLGCREEKRNRLSRYEISSIKQKINSFR